MLRFKLHLAHYVIAISGFAHDQPVWFGRRLKIHTGPTVELTIAFPQDPATALVTVGRASVDFQLATAVQGSQIEVARDEDASDLRLARKI